MNGFLLQIVRIAPEPKAGQLPSHICVAIRQPSELGQSLYHRVPVRAAMEEPEEEEKQVQDG